MIKSCAFTIFLLFLLLQLPACQTSPHRSLASANYSLETSLVDKCEALKDCSIKQHTQLLKWADSKLEQISKIDVNNRSERELFEEPDYYIVKNKKLSELTVAEKNRIADSTQLYFNVMGKNSLKSFLWTGIEPGNPLTRFEDYRWNSLREQGMYDKEKRKKLIQKMQSLGIRNMRLGLSNHEINLEDKNSWKAMDEMVEDFYNGGIYISLDLHHFGIEDRFRVLDENGKTDGAKSYYLNPLWPDYFAAFSEEAIRRYGKFIKAITIMNEPETVAGFNGEMWHGGFPGWSHPESNRYYIERCLQVGIASVKARLRIEKYLATLEPENRPRFVYVHTEAGVHKVYWPEFNNNRRFLISDMILGHEDLIEGPYEEIANMSMEDLRKRWGTLPAEQKTNFNWVMENYLVFNRTDEELPIFRKNILARLKNLRDLHHELKETYGKTMRTDAVFAIDYYAHNEDHDLEDVKLNPEPQNYIEQLKARRRVGLYSIVVDYYNHFKMPMMGGELGTPYYYYGSKWNQQMLLEASQAASQGIPFLGYAVYPAIDTWGWESALSVPKKDSIFNPSGVFTLELEPRVFIKNLINSLESFLGR